MIQLDSTVVSESLRPIPDTRVITWIDAQLLEALYLAKTPTAQPEVEKIWQANLGEIARHLRGIKPEHVIDDEGVMTSDYRLLPVRRRFWKRGLRTIETTGTVSQLRSQLRVARGSAGHCHAAAGPCGVRRRPVRPDRCQPGLHSTAAQRGLRKRAVFLPLATPTHSSRHVCSSSSISSTSCRPMPRWKSA